METATIAPPPTELVAALQRVDKQEAAMTRPKAAVFKPDVIATMQVQATTTRDEVERGATLGLLKQMQCDRVQLIDKRDAQALVVAAARDSLSHEEAKLRDNETAISIIDVVINQLTQASKTDG